MEDFQKLRENILFSDLTDNDFKKLFDISIKLQVNKGDYFLREGDIAEDFYFILSGYVAITKLEEEHQNEHVIAYVESGNAIGEIALLDHHPRSASARAETSLELLRIPFKKLLKLAEESKGLGTIISRITQNLGGRIRQSNLAIVTALENQIHEYKLRSAIGMFMMNVIFCLCLFIICVSWLTNEIAASVSSTAVTLPVTVIFLMLFFSIMKSSKLPRSTFGLTTKNWRKAIIESVLFTSIVCIGVVVLKWIFVSTSIAYPGHHIFEPYFSINAYHLPMNLTVNQTWWLIVAAYWFVVAPLQELIARGGLQGPLEVFLTGKYASLKAIFLSNVMFGSLHIIMGIGITILVFFAGIYFGWLYSRHHNLIGVIIAHGMLGTWGLMVVGL